MTSPPPLEPPPGNRALRIALLAATAVIVVAGLVAIVVLVPGHKSSRTTAKATTASASTQHASPSQASSPRTSPSSLPDTGPSPVSSLGGLVVPSGDPQAARKKAIASAFVAFNNVVNDMSTTKTANFTRLTQVAADPLLPAMEDGIAKLYGEGWIAQGRSTLSNLTIQSIAPDGQSATLTACADISHTHTVNAKTGATIAPSVAPSPRIIDAGTLRIRDGRWKVTGLTHPGTC